MDDDIRIQGQSGTAVLLLHGLCGNPLELQPLVNRLRKAGHTVSVPFIAGYGISQTQQRVTSYESWLTLARARIAALRREHERVLIGGICIGADLSLALGAEADIQVDGLILISPTLFYDGWNIPRSRAWLPLAFYTPLRYWYRFRETAPFGIKNERLRAWIADMMQRESASPAGAAYLPATSLYQTHRLIKHVKRHLPRVAAPTLILHAVEDDVSSPLNAQFIAQRIGSQQIDLHWFHDSYHMLTLDNEREQVADKVLDFVHHASH